MGGHEILATCLALCILFLYWLLGAIFCIFKYAFLASKKKPQKPIGQRKREPSITEADLKKLIYELNRSDESGWEFVLEKSGHGVSYFAKRREPKNGGPTEYLSTTVFQNCSPELLRDFYMDNEFRLEWDKTVEKHEQLGICLESGTEVGRTIKKFPWMTPREYVLTWRLWEGEDRTFYCVVKACEHRSAPRRNGYMRVEEYTSGWRIRTVPGSPDASEVKMLHAENIGVRREMAKLAFSRGIWSYVTKMEHNLRRYHPNQHKIAPDAVTLCRKVPAELDQPRTVASNAREIEAAPHYKVPSRRQASRNRFNGFLKLRNEKARSSDASECGSKRISVLTQSMFLLGWAVFLGHGSTSLGAKIAAAIFMNKAMRTKRYNASSSSPSSSTTSRHISRKGFSLHRPH